MYNILYIIQALGFISVHKDANMPLSHAFDVIEWTSLKWTIGVGAVFGMCAW